MPYANHKGANKNARPRSLFSAFVVRCPYGILPILANSEISRLLLVSVPEQAGLSLTRTQTLKTGFSHDVAHARIIFLKANCIKHGYI